MNLFLILIYFMLIFGFIYNFKKKVSMLLILEGFMLIIIFFFGCFFNFSMYSNFLCMLLSIFMVLDSVFGMSLLIFSSRNSIFCNMSFSNL